MNELDLEELESRLYSQIYHESHEENHQNSPKPTMDLTKSPLAIKNPNRYFAPWSPHQKYKRSSSGNIPKSSSINNSKNYRKSYRSDISINQVVVLSPNRPIVCLSKKQLRGKFWRENIKLRRKEQRLRKKLGAQRRQRQNNENVDQNQENNGIVDLPNNNNETVITLSDSEDDSCVLLENDSPAVDLNQANDSKHDAPKSAKKQIESSSDDVIFVEPVKVPEEIINVDEESESGTQQINTENASPKDVVEQQIHQERKELLNTPDSASNDFLNNSGIELSQRNFNFSLYGSDFNAGVFLKPTRPTEHCETESSSSTTDVNFVNLMKTVVFNEIEFPKEDIFAGGNLERFESLITTARGSTSSTTVQSTPVKTPEVLNHNVYSSESSESDFEDSQMDKSKSKSLPELSPFHKSPERSKEKQKIKNKKKKKNLKDVDENIAQNKADEDTKQNKRKSANLEDNDITPETPMKKKIKNKKKKNEVTRIDHQDKQVVVDANINKNNIELEKKQLDKKDSIELKEVSDTTEKIVDEKTEVSKVAVDEKNSVTSSASESILSALNEESSIQINTETEKKDNSNLIEEKDADLDNFSVKNLQLQMSNDPKLWDILDKDRFPSGKFKGRRCNKCREIGHGSLRCPNKKYPKCQLCGEAGHYEPRCPNKLCTQCGLKSSYLTNYCGSCFKYRNYRCRLCSMLGHIDERCPDLWRRYHLTTSEGPLNSPDGPVLKSKGELWCSGCARNGHLEHDCEFFKSLYPPVDPSIKSYDDVYGRRPESPANHQQPSPRPNPFIADAQVNYGIPITSKVNPNILLDQNCQSYQNAVSNNYFSPTNFGFMNNQFQNVDPNFMFLANQQNFFSGIQNVLPLPQNNIMQPSQARYQNTTQNSQGPFEKPLPPFISLETGVVESTPFKADSPKSRYVKNGTASARRFNAIFFSSPSTHLQHFISEELQALSKLSLVANKVAKELRKRQVPRRPHEREEYYRTLNMVLFGIFSFLDGKSHVERLKQFKMERNNKSRTTSAMRQQLLKSFTYIFGQDPHEGVNYADLLRRF